MKYIKPSKGRAYNPLTDTELGNSPEEQLYNLKKDWGEQHNIAKENAKKVNELKTLLQKELEAKK